ncbi:hypothetical protein PMIN04_010899 [Paraphaeosphaeria minitans]
MNKRAEDVVHPEWSVTGWEKRAEATEVDKRQGPHIESSVTCWTCRDASTGAAHEKRQSLHIESSVTGWTKRAQPTVDVDKRQGPHIESSVTCWTCRAQPTAEVVKRQGPHIEPSVTGWKKRAAPTDVGDEDDSIATSGVTRRWCRYKWC